MVSDNFQVRTSFLNNIHGVKKRASSIAPKINVIFRTFPFTKSRAINLLLSALLASLTSSFLRDSLRKYSNFTFYALKPK